MAINEFLSRPRLVELLESIANLRIGVVGDFTLDGYWYAEMARSQISRETPLFPRPITRETYSLGGSANVAWNLAVLGTGQVWAFSVLGNDWRGMILRQLMEEAGIRREALLTEPDRMTSFYGKVILTAWGKEQEDARLDFINTLPLREETEDALLAQVEACLPELDALIIADYQLGVITPRVADRLLALARRFPDKTFVVDSRDRVGHFQQFVVKPNQIEAAALFYPGRDPAAVTLPELADAGLKLHQQTHQPVFITLGEQGCLVCAGERSLSLPGISVPPPTDPVGAGDAFLASLCAGLAAGALPAEAACLANLAAAVTVAQIRITGAASPEQITGLYDRQ